MKKILIAFFAGLVSASSAQTGVFLPGSSGADSLINSFMRKWDITGGSVAISHQGKLIYNSGFGYKNSRHTQRATPGTRYRIASVSKPITAIAIMKLVQEGKLGLSDTVFGDRRLISHPYYTEGIADPRIFSITVEHLLEHTAGWDRLSAEGEFRHSDWPFYPLEVTAAEKEPNPVGDSTLIRHQLRKVLNYAPGTTFAYSNIGYLVLGKIIEKITGQNYAEYITRNIFSPVSACDLALGNNLRSDKLSRESEYISTYYTQSCYGDGSMVPSQYGGFNLEAMNAHGGWIASASDLVRILLSVDKFETSPDILQPEYSGLMTAPGAVNPYYAKGWSVNKKNNWWHTGSLDGTASFVCRTDSGYTWAMLFNGRGDNSAQFWKEFDRLPWKCIEALPENPNTDLFAPSENVSGFRWAQTGSGKYRISWMNGNGKARLILATEQKEIIGFPVDGTQYFGSAAFGAGSHLGDGTFVVYNGTGSEFSLTGLEPGKTYTISGIEYNLSEETAYQEVYKLGCAEEIRITPELLPVSMP